MSRKAEPLSTYSPSDLLAIRIEELNSQYTDACRKAERTRDASDNALAESLRQQVQQASAQFQILNGFDEL